MTRSSSPPELTSAAREYVDAVDALNGGNWPLALQLADRLAQQAPRLAEVRYVAGVAALNLSQVSTAIRHLHLAVTLDPSRADYLGQYAKALIAARMMRQAVEAADIAVSLAPSDPQTLSVLGVIYSRANEHRKSADMNRRAAALRPESATFRFNLASSLTFCGDIDGAEAEYEAALGLDPRLWKAHLALSQSRKQCRDANHTVRLRTLLEQPGVDVEGRTYLHLALSKELEDLGQLDDSFQHLCAGKAAGRTQIPDAFQARDAELFNSLIEAFQRPPDTASGHATEEPIFVVGMPRSGTTLVDRILSAHPDVHSAGELHNFSVALKRASGSRSPWPLDAQTVALARDLDWKAVGAAYIESTRPGTGHAPRFVDKLPHNFLYAAYIAQALPKARIICLRRNPMDTCLSNFRQLFSRSATYCDYSFDLLDTGRYFLMFDRLMAHWRRVLPGRILEVNYEDLVCEQEVATRRLLVHCGLEWNDACLRFDENSAPVATASAVQVREPMYRTAMQRWKRYETQLAGLKNLLEEGGISIAE